MPEGGKQMARAIAELEERKRTDRRLSFGLYLVFLIVIIAICIVIGVLGSLIVGSGAGKAISTIVSLLVAIYIWWYNWLLYKRRNEHFDRMKRLKGKLSTLIGEKVDKSNESLLQVDPLVTRRERHHSVRLFVFWLIFSYLSSAAPLLDIYYPLSWLEGLLGLPALIIGLVILYYLTVDYYYHEQGEIAFFTKATEILSKKEISFTVAPAHPLKRRSYGLYIFLSIITVGIFLIYWTYVIFHDPNRHFDTHEVWESALG